MARYHEWLEDSLEHDRQFQLNATWGILDGIGSLVSLAIAIWLSNLWFETAWIAGASMFFIWLGLSLTFNHYNHKGREKDAKKLARLPDWEKL